MSNELHPRSPLIAGHYGPPDGHAVPDRPNSLESVPGGDLAASASARLRALSADVKSLPFSSGTVALHSFLGACSVVPLPIELLTALENAVLRAKRYDFK